MAAQLNTAEERTRLYGRWATVTLLECECGDDIRYVKGETFDEVKLASDENSKLVELNSVALVPSLLTEAECESLVADVERCHAVFLDNSLEQNSRHTPYPTHVTAGRARWKIRDLSEASQLIFKSMFLS